MSERGNSNIEEYIITSIVRGINEILSSLNLDINQIEMIGIATPGNPVNGVIYNIINLGIDAFDICSELKKYFYNTVIKVENDGTCAGLAEKILGNLVEFSDCIFLCFGTGIGGSLFLNNKLYKTNKGSGFEIGHMIIKKDGKKCRCGNDGCFEAYCSKKQFKEILQLKLGIDGYISARDLINVINENENAEVKEIINEYCEYLSIGIANLINIFEPEAISIGGSMSHYADLIFPQLKENIKNGKYIFNKENTPMIFTSKAENDAGIIGAVLI